MSQFSGETKSQAHTIGQPSWSNIGKRRQPDLCDSGLSILFALQ